MPIEVREYLALCATSNWLMIARSVRGLHEKIAKIGPPGPVYVSTRIFNTRIGRAYQDRLLYVIRPKVGTKSGTSPSGLRSVEMVN